MSQICNGFTGNCPFRVSGIVTMTGGGALFCPSPGAVILRAIERSDSAGRVRNGCCGSFALPHDLRFLRSLLLPLAFRRGLNSLRRELRVFPQPRFIAAVSRCQCRRRIVSRWGRSFGTAPRHGACVAPRAIQAFSFGLSAIAVPHCCCTGWSNRFRSFRPTTTTKFPHHFIRAELGDLMNEFPSPQPQIQTHPTRTTTSSLGRWWLGKAG